MEKFYKIFLTSHEIALICTALEIFNFDISDNDKKKRILELQNNLLKS